MKQFMHAIVILLGAAGCLFAQTAPDTLWAKKYGPIGMDWASAVLQCADGGYHVLGTTTTHGAGGTDIMLIRTNATGDTLWTRTFGGTGNEEPRDLAATAEGGFIIVANSTSMNDGHTYPYCLRVNAQGDTLWTRFLLTTQDGDYQSICRAGVGYMILGNANSDVFLLKLDQNGDTLWSRFLGVGGNGRQLRGTTDGGFVANGNNSGSMVAMKMDSVGNVLWYRAFRGGQSIGAAATSDGGGVATGDGYGYFTGDRYDAAGNHLWSRTYGAYYNNGYCVVQAYDGSSVFGGYCNPNAEWSGVPCLYKTDTSGNVIWSDPFPYLYRGIIFRGIVTRDHGYAFIGWTNVDGNPQPFLLKLASDSSNIVPCPPTPLPFIDNFDSPDLDSCWFWIREDTSHWSVTERPGWMRIETQDGEIDLSNNRNMLMRPKPAGHFAVESHVAIQPVDFHNGLGILLYNTDTQFVLLQRCYSSGQVLHFHDPSTGLNSSIAVGDTNMFLRLEVVDSLVTARWSSDGLVWNFAGSHVSPWLTGSNYMIGIEAKNGGTPGGSEIPVDFDYFRVDPLPGTTVCGNVSGLWDSTGSPYYVTCDVTVPVGQTLEIRRGVQVLFTGHYKFNVLGNLQAIGTEQDSIVFTRAFPTEESKWDGMRFNAGSDSSHISYCVLEYGRKDGTWWPPEPNTSGGAVSCASTSPTFEHSTFRNNSAGTGGGAFYSDLSSSPSFFRCLIEENHSASHGGGLYGDGTMRCEDCIIRGNHSSDAGGGVFLGVNTIATFSRCGIEGNIATTWGGGIANSLDANVLVDHCTIVVNAAASGGGYGVYSNLPPTLINSVVWGNTGSGGQAWGTITYSDIQGGYAGTGNINTNPMFVDTANGDFHLQANSPCIDTGDPNSPLDPDSTRADMGAFPYFHPCLMVDPDSLEFGLLDLGTDSTLEIVLRNPTSQPIPVTAVFCALPAFSVDTTGLGGQVPPFATYHLSVTFSPSTAGAYTDTLVIAVQQPCDTLISIPLHGEADVILLPVDSLVIQRGPMNGIQLDWAPVTHSISGQPVQNILYAIYGSTSCQGPFFPFGYSTTNSYVHPNILNGQPMYFYQVTADVGSGRRTR